MKIATSRFINRLTGGDKNEMFCSRAYRCNWRRLVKFLDMMFYKDGHCHDCYLFEQQQKRGRPCK